MQQLDEQRVALIDETSDAHQRAALATVDDADAPNKPDKKKQTAGELRITNAT